LLCFFATGLYYMLFLCSVKRFRNFVTTNFFYFLSASFIFSSRNVFYPHSIFCQYFS